VTALARAHVSSIVAFVDKSWLLVAQASPHGLRGSSASPARAVWWALLHLKPLAVHGATEPDTLKCRVRVVRCMLLQISIN